MLRNSLIIFTIMAIIFAITLSGTANARAGNLGGISWCGIEYIQMPGEKYILHRKSNNTVLNADSNLGPVVHQVKSNPDVFAWTQGTEKPTFCFKATRKSGAPHDSWPLYVVVSNGTRSETYELEFNSEFRDTHKMFTYFTLPVGQIGGKRLVEVQMYLTGLDKDKEVGGFNITIDPSLSPNLQPRIRYGRMENTEFIPSEDLTEEKELSSYVWIEIFFPDRYPLPKKIVCQKETEWGPMDAGEKRIDIRKSGGNRNISFRYFDKTLNEGLSSIRLTFSDQDMDVIATLSIPTDKEKFILGG